MIETEYIEAIRDSLTSVLPLLRELAENSSPEPYVIENLWWTKLNVAISIIAAIIGGLGAYYGYKGFIYAKETARNVARMPQETQLKLCRSLLEDLLRNYVRATIISYNHRQGLKPPSDNYISNFMLPEFEDIFTPESLASFFQNKDAYVCLHYLKSRMKHYNHMVEVIESHCINDGITDKDREDLVTKTLRVMRSLFKFIEKLEGTDDVVKHTLIKKIAKPTDDRKKKTEDVFKSELKEKIANLTEDRKESVKLNDENKQIFQTIVAAMKSDLEKFKFDDVSFKDESFKWESAVPETIQQFMNREEGEPSITEMLAYNGIIERQYLK